MKPQSKQTTSVGNTKTAGLSRSLNLGKWMLISAPKLVLVSRPTRFTSHKRFLLANPQCSNRATRFFFKVQQNWP